MVDPERRRRRPAVSCTVCRRRKVRCNRESPCSNCVRSKTEHCVYENLASQAPHEHLRHGQGALPELTADLREPQYLTQSRNPSVNTTSTYTGQSAATPGSSTAASTLGSQSSSREIESMRSRIRNLEEQLCKTITSSAPSPATTSSSNIIEGGTSHVRYQGHLFGEIETISRSIAHKTRLFGQSHFIVGVPLVRDMYETIEPHMRSETSKAVQGLQRCKSLARVIKAQRAPEWPTVPTSDLPPKDVADGLVDCYLRTTEAVYRVLHVPTFRRDYEALWVTDAEPAKAFLVQLKLALAIGATTYDDTFSLRGSAIRWVYEAQTWLSDPVFKSRLGIQALQMNILLLLARELTDVGGGLVWASGGTLLRTAMHMGLHKDPASLPKMSAFVAEMRRRLWNTVLEITLQSSLASGGPPLIALDDFDTAPPSNYDDEQLMAEDPVPKPENDFTQMSTAIALRRTFPQRLAIAKFLNDLSSKGTYEEALRLDAEMRTAFKVLSQTLQKCRLSQFELTAVDVIMRRYLSAIHIPFFAPSLHDPTFAFSRKVAVDCSLKIWGASCPHATAARAGSSTNEADSCHDFSRLVMCGSGFFRTVAFQASFIIGVELKTQLQEEENMGPVSLRPDLVSALEDSVAWSLRCIEAGETNIKGYLLVRLIGAYINGLVRGLGKDDLAAVLVRATEDAEETCLPILENVAARCRSAVGDGQSLLNISDEFGEGWDMMMSDALLNSGNEDPMSWFLQ